MSVAVAWHDGDCVIVRISHDEVRRAIGIEIAERQAGEKALDRY